MDFEGIVLFEEGADPENFIAAGDVQSVLRCGLIATFDR